MRVNLHAALRNNSGAQYNPNTRTIEMNIEDLQRMCGRRWRKVAAYYFVHEFIHYLCDIFYGWRNPYQLYKEELICYKVARLLGSALCIRVRISDEDGAIYSVTHAISYMKRMAGL